jgi:hypothetical protein
MEEVPHHLLSGYPQVVVWALDLPVGILSVTHKLSIGCGRSDIIPRPFSHRSHIIVFSCSIHQTSRQVFQTSRMRATYFVPVHIITLGYMSFIWLCVFSAVGSRSLTAVAVYLRMVATLEVDCEMVLEVEGGEGMYQWDPFCLRFGYRCCSRCVLE